MGVIAYIGGKKMLCVAVASLAVGTAVPTVYHKAKTHISRQVTPHKAVSNPQTVKRDIPPCEPSYSSQSVMPNFYSSFTTPTVLTPTTQNVLINPPADEIVGGWVINRPVPPIAPPPNGSVPEPTTWSMFILGYAAIGYSIRKDKNAKNYTSVTSTSNGLRI